MAAAVTVCRRTFVVASLRSSSGLPESRTFTVTTPVPTLTQVTQSVRVAAPGDYRLPQQNLFDLRLSKTIRSAAPQFEPTADLFNVFNSNAVTSAVTTLGSSLLRPSNINNARLLRLGTHRCSTF